MTNFPFATEGSDIWASIDFAGEARSGADATIQALRNLVVSFIKCTL